MIPTKDEAIQFVFEASQLNPGVWVEHSFNAAKAAEIIASQFSNLNTDKAYVCGLLHDIGRREGIYDLHHTIYGYNYLTALGYEEIGKACLTHSFIGHDIHEFIGEYDCSEEEIKFIRDYLKQTQYDDYDRIVQLCDYIAIPEGFCILEKRMINVVLRKGFNKQTIDKWKRVFQLKETIEKEMNQPLYQLLPNICETTLK